MQKKYLIILSLVLCASLGLSSASAANVADDYDGPDFDDIGKTVESFTINTTIMIDDVTTISKDCIEFSTKVMTTNWFDEQDLVSVGQLVLYDKNHDVVAYVDLSENPNPYFCISLEENDRFYLEYHGVTFIDDEYHTITYNDAQVITIHK
jgi:hypothetical protein